MRPIFLLLGSLAVGCATPQPLPPCPEPGPPDHELVTPAELELAPEHRMPEGATPPEVTDAPPPVLPDDAFDKTEGPEVAIVKYRVDESGSVVSTEVTRGRPPFSTAAVEAVTKMKFRPATFDGQPIAVFQIRRFVFRHNFVHCQDGPQGATPVE